jgi:hypothetical protein
MERAYKMALVLIKTYIEKENYPDKNTIKAMCEEALGEAIESEGDCDVCTR